MPELGAVISFSIFMASITQTSAPSSTWPPFSTATFSTVPWMRRDELAGRAAAAALLALAALAPPCAAAGGGAVRPRRRAPITFTSKRVPDTSTA